MTVTSPNVTLENLTIRNGGNRRWMLDAAVSARRVAHLYIRNCRLENVHFGIIFDTLRQSRIENCDISSQTESVADNRGDGIRLMNASQIRIANNRLHEARDLAVVRSNAVRIERNRIENGRYGVLVQMSRNVTVTDNTVIGHYVGIFAKNARELNITRNRIVKTRLATGTGIMLVGGEKLYVTHNTISRHAQAIYIDAKARSGIPRRYIEHNLIALNNEALHFHAAVTGNVIRRNILRDNLADVAKDIPSAVSQDNTVAYNYWDRYEGFDENGDGIGDTPYLVLLYADKLWLQRPALKFFYAAPLLGVLDFIERLAPFDTPLLLFKDPLPLMQPPFDAALPMTQTSS